MFYPTDKKTKNKLLACPLTPSEREQYALRSCELRSEHDRLIEEAKELAAKSKGKIKAVANRIKELTTAVNSGKEIRAIECVQTLDREFGIITTVRTDTGEEIERRSVFGDELQTTMYEFDNQSKSEDFCGNPHQEDLPGKAEPIPAKPDESDSDNEEPSLVDEDPIKPSEDEKDELDESVTKWLRELHESKTTFHATFGLEDLKNHFSLDTLKAAALIKKLTSGGIITPNKNKKNLYSICFCPEIIGAIKKLDFDPEDNLLKRLSTDRKSEDEK
jgi:hypothetical protein